MTYLHRGTREIAVLGFEGVQSLDVVGPMEVFAVANLHSPPGPKPYRITLASQAGGEIVTHAGLRLAGAVALKDLPDEIDTIVIAGGSEEALRAASGDQGITPWLTERATNTRRIASVCTGAFVFGSVGIARRASGNDALEPLRHVANALSRRAGGT